MRLTRDLKALNQEFDLVVIGGGITGVAVAREAAARGLKTCVLEKNDFGWATSAATSKLLHGGLRYLENYEFSLVRESLAERRILGCAAPHLVKPLGFILPIYKGAKPGRFIFQLGLIFYDLLSYDRNWKVPADKRVPRHRWLNPEELRKLEPTIDPKDLQGGFIYYDYQSLHPERLTLDWVLTGAKAGALYYNHMEVRDFELERETDSDRKRVRAVKVRDTIGGKEYKVRGRVFVNATGPWMDLVLGKVEEKPETSLSRSTGIHFLTEPFLNGHAVLFKTKTGRHFFALPWDRFALIGPTDVPYKDDPDQVAPRAEEIEQLYTDVHETLHEAPLTRKGIHLIFTGIRPLIFSGKSTYRASRKSEIYDHTASGFDGFLSVAGGKWTTSRRLGEDMVKRVLAEPELAGFQAKKADTSRQAFVGSPGFAVSAEEYMARSLRENAHPKIPEDVLRHLITMYGVRHTDILARVKKDPALAARVSKTPGELDILAQIDEAVEVEGALTLEDLLRRRLAIGTYGPPNKAALAACATRMAKLLKWSPAQKQKELRAVDEFYKKSLAGLSVLDAGGKRKK